MNLRIILSLIALCCFIDVPVAGQSDSKANKLKLDLQTVADAPRVPQSSFVIGETVYVRVFVHNQSDERIGIAREKYKTHKLYLLSLTKNGHPVKYTETMRKTIEEARESAFGGGRVTTLHPGERKEIDLLYLAHWFDMREPGNYELTLILDMKTQGKTAPEIVRFNITEK